MINLIDHLSFGLRDKSYQDWVHAQEESHYPVGIVQVPLKTGHYSRQNALTIKGDASDSCRYVILC